MDLVKRFIKNLLVELEKPNREYMRSGTPVTAEAGQSLTINITKNNNCIPYTTMEKGGTITMNILDDTDITLCKSFVEGRIIIESGGELIINTVGSTLPIINNKSLSDYIDKASGSKLTINYNAKL